MSDDPRARAARTMLSTLPLVMRVVGGAMRESGGDVTPHQHRLLGMLAAHPLTLSQVADVQGVTRATATTLVTTLENRGWVERTHDAHDRRKVVVTLTDSGREHLAVAQRAAEQAMTDALATLTDDEIARLTDGLGVLGALRDRHSGHCGFSHPATHENGPAHS